MCGIVGLAGISDFYSLSSMIDLISHRGPDDKGEFIDREHGIALAMCRLAIIDLESGNQPLSNEDGDIWVVCNGEIYNSPELRQHLLAKGHTFKTKNSDTEVLLHLYEENGTNLLHKLNGMFAFVLYDKKKGIVFGARDRMGIKPFYYAHKQGKFAFASELKSLVTLPWVSKEINFTSLYHYVSLQFIPAPDSIFHDIKKLPAGHFLVYHVTQKQLDVDKYWDLNVTQFEEKKVDEWLEVIKENLKESVKRWTLSDVPIACSLSGGIDSASIVGLLAQSGMNDLRTYSLGFALPEEQGCNELPLAMKVAKKWGTKHHEIVLKPEKILEDLEQMVWYLDEPYGGGLPSWYIYEFVGRDTKVCLTGTGGDELFGNYGKYNIYERGKWYRYLKTIKDAAVARSFREIKNGLQFPVGHFYHRYFTDVVKDRMIFSGNNYPRVKTEPYLEDIWNKSHADNPRNAVAYVDFKLQLPEEFLLVTDRFSMAHSVEARTPFLDHTLVELVFKIPPVMRTGWGDQKSLLRRIVKEVIPDEVLHASKKGFILPLHVWTRNELKSRISDLLSPDYLKKQGIFSSLLFKQIVEPHFSGKKDCTQQVWTLFMFQLWYNTFC